jgi:hypothetical protein
MKKSELKEIIKEEIRNVLSESKVTPFSDFIYKNEKDPNQKIVKVDLSDDPEVSRLKDIKHIFVVTKNTHQLDPNKRYYQVYYQSAKEGKNPDYWISAHSKFSWSTTALRGDLTKKIINIARKHLT